MKNKNILLFLVLLFTAILLRCINLQRGIGGDEAITLESASAGLNQVIPVLVKNDAHPPLTSLLLHFWMTISQNEIFIRFYFIIFGIGVLLVLYFIACEYMDYEKNFALFTLFLGAISPMLISLSQFIRNYIDSAFWMLLSNYFLLRILKHKANKWVWIGYAASVLLSIYSFYFSFMMVIAQSIYIALFKLRERALIKKWALSQGAVILLYLPWIPYAYRQLFNNEASSSSLHWERFGFRMAGLDLGVYARNISALFGLDHFFMVYPEGIVNHFGLPLLCVMAALAFFSVLVLLAYAVKMLRERFASDAGMIWFLPCLSVLPIVISWIVAKLTNTAPNVRYLAAPHTMYLILISYFLYHFISQYKKSGTALLFLFIFLYLARLPAATTAMYEDNKALQYLSTHVRQGDCIVMVDSLDGREKLPIPSFNIEGDLFELDRSTSQYRLLSDKTKIQKIERLLKPFKRVWFVRCYGNTEIFGGNKLVYDFLTRCARKETDTLEVHYIKIILFE